MNEASDVVQVISVVDLLLEVSEHEALKALKQPQPQVASSVHVYAKLRPAQVIALGTVYLQARAPHPLLSV